VPAPGVETIPGFRRFGLDPARYLRWTLTRALGFAIAIAVVVAGVALVLARGAPPDSGGVGVVAVLVLVAIRFLLAPRVRALLAAAPTYELLVTPRVLRLTMGGFAPAEILRPEVTRILEGRVGLVVLCDGSGHVLFVGRVVDGYDDVRRELAAWHPIEVTAGWRSVTASIAPRRSPPFELREHDGGGPALAADPSLRDELQLARQASSEEHLAYVPPGARPLSLSQRAVRSIVLAVGAVVALVIWSVLHPPASTRPTGSPSRSTTVVPK
jgi:hypothetical protein